MPDTIPAAPHRDPVHASLALAGVLAAALLLTRLGHFGELSRLPDASWAVFFLGGLALRGTRAFAVFFGLAWLVDLAAIALGTPADCFSPAYLFLVPAYGALWAAGRLAGSLARSRSAVAEVPGRRLPRLALAAATLPLAVLLAFVLSNAGVLLLGGGAAPEAADYAARVAVYLPGYLGVTLAYVGAALALHAVAARRVLSAPRAARGPGSA
ncbi:MAG: hypothetical protein MUF07_11060 [Steroidobacteraceae bacterium]|jgi:hypothetical protein|nr:hypothetical protein [Steroidobacteraceae bacterium]